MKRIKGTEEVAWTPIAREAVFALTRLALAEDERREAEAAKRTKRKRRTPSRQRARVARK